MPGEGPPASSLSVARFFPFFSFYQRCYLLSFGLASSGFLQGKGVSYLEKGRICNFSYLPMDFLSRVEAYIQWHGNYSFYTGVISFLLLTVLLHTI